MKIVTYGKYKCPYCGTVVELESEDVHRWYGIMYYDCPFCGKTPRIKDGNLWCPYDIEGKKAIRVD